MHRTTQETPKGRPEADETLGDPSSPPTGIVKLSPTTLSVSSGSVIPRHRPEGRRQRADSLILVIDSTTRHPYLCRSHDERALLRQPASPGKVVSRKRHEAERQSSGWPRIDEHATVLIDGGSMSKDRANDVAHHGSKLAATATLEVRPLLFET